MKKRPGFTLAELLLAVMIFGFMATSLATIYSTSNRHMFQNYRANIVKTNVGVAMKAVQNQLSIATKLDVPAYNASGNILAFATNVDQLTGCYPIYDAPPTNGIDTPAWHYFCIAPDMTDPTINSLYYHTGTIPGGAGCGAASPSIWNGPYPAFCGPGGGGTVTMLVQGAVPNPVFFSRRPAETVMVNGAPVVVRGVTERDQVWVSIRSFWSASARGFGKSQRDVDFTLTSVFRVQKYAW